MSEHPATPGDDAPSTELSNAGLKRIGDRLCDDLVERWQRGERVPVEAYLRQHPELDDEDDIFELVLTEVVLRQSSGEPAPLEEYQWRFPDFSERLRRHFALQAELDSSTMTSSSPPRRLAALRVAAEPVVPGFEILGELGRGGMGIVYRAREPHLERHVALKFLPQEYADDRERLDRFLREARTTSALNHPHICTVHSLGEHKGQPFIVMELIDGVTLRQLMNPRPRVEEAARLLAQAARALGAAHAEGVVHRDLKPENIMVREDGYVKVLDFGLARRLPTLSGETAGGNVDTEAGTLLGTPAYMSPEQAHGRPSDSTSDVFSMGTILYEALTGRHPFAAESGLATLHAIAREQQAPPSRWNPEVPPALDALVEGMLHKDCRLRPTADEVADTLRALMREGFPRAAASPPRPIVERARELDLLRAAAQNARAGRGAVVCVAGEPGIGKTTLVDGFLDELAARDWLLARGRCSERLAGTEAYLPVIEALGDLLRTETGSSAARLMRTVAPTWYSGICSITTPAPGDAWNPSRASSQPAMLREFCNFLREVSRLNPVVLFFDDVHWADDSTVDLLAHFGRLCREMRVLAVVTYRPTELLLGPHPFHRVRQELQVRGACSEIAVSFLGREEIDRYLTLVFPDHNLPEDFADLVSARTEGNPLFMADLLRDLRERRVIAECDGRWALARDLPDVQQDLPLSVRSMIQRKLERLDRDDRRLLAAAAAHGHEFESSVIADALQQDPADVEERLQTLDRIHGLVRRLREHEFPDRTLSVRYAFVHILYQQALDGDLPPSRRATLSAALARSLEGRLGDSTAAAAELACLYEAGRDAAQSARQFHLAAQNAAHVFAHREAVALARRGLRQLETLPDSVQRRTLELSLQTTLGMQLQVTTGFAASEAREAYLRARELCRQAPDETPLFPVLWGLWLYSKVRSQLSKAQEMADELRDLAARRRDPDLAIQAHQALGMTAFCRGRPAAAVQHVEQVSALYDSDRHRRHSFMFGQDPAVICKAYGAVALWLMGFSEQAQRQSDEAIRMSHSLSPSSQTVALHFAAMLHQLRRDSSGASACAGASCGIAGEHGFSFWLAGANVLSGWALAASGKAHDGLSVLQQGLRDWTATESVTYQTYYLGLLAEVLDVTGRVAEGCRVVDEALVLVQRTGEELFEAELHRRRGELLLKQGDRDAETEAEACFQQALTVAREQQALGLELRAAVSAARLARSRNRGDEARTILDPVCHRITEGFDSADYRDAIAILEQCN
jgi:predicted ATPase